MAKATTAYTAEDGTVFTNEYEAWKHDLYCYFMSVVSNEYVSKQLVENVCSELVTSDHFSKIIGHLIATGPISKYEPERVRRLA